MLDQVRTELQLSERHAMWLEDVRKIPCELAAELGIVSKGPHLAFEYRRHGQLLFRQIRKELPGGDKTFRLEAPDGRTLKEAGIGLSFWQEDDLTGSSSPDVPRIITEGQFDTAAFRLAGFPLVGSVPNGASGRPSEGEIVAAEDTGFSYLWEFDEAADKWRLRGGLATCARIILATDGDKAGRVLRDELAVRLGRDRCWVVEYPEGEIGGHPIKDANDVLRKWGADEGCERLRDMVADARPLVAPTLVPMSQIPEVKREYLRTGWKELDTHLKVTRPELMIVSGPPGDGKSQFVTALGASLAYLHGWKGAVLQFEDDVERIREDFVKFWCGRREADPTVAENRAQALAWVDQQFRTVSPDESEGEHRFDLSWLDAKLTEAARVHGCQFAVIDPWNEVEHAWHKGITETQYLNDALRNLKRTSRRLSMCLIIVTHPDKAAGRIKDIEEWDLYSISGGQAWNNKADHGIIVLRPDKEKRETFIKVSKSKRHLVMGRPGIVVMRLNPLKATYEFVGHHEGTQ